MGKRDAVVEFDFWPIPKGIRQIRRVWRTRVCRSESTPGSLKRKCGSEAVEKKRWDNTYNKIKWKQIKKNKKIGKIRKRKGEGKSFVQRSCCVRKWLGIEACLGNMEPPFLNGARPIAESAIWDLDNPMKAPWKLRGDRMSWPWASFELDARHGLSWNGDGQPGRGVGAILRMFLKRVRHGGLGSWNWNAGPCEKYTGLFFSFQQRHEAVG